MLKLSKSPEEGRHAMLLLKATSSLPGYKLIHGVVVCRQEFKQLSGFTHVVSNDSTVDPRISEGNGTEPPLDMQNLRICKKLI